MSQNKMAITRRGPSMVENACVTRPIIMVTRLEVTVEMWNDVAEYLDIHLDRLQHAPERLPGIGHVFSKGLPHGGIQVVKFYGVSIKHQDTIATHVLIGAKEPTRDAKPRHFDGIGRTRCFAPTAKLA